MRGAREVTAARGAAFAAVCMAALVTVPSCAEVPGRQVRRYPLCNELSRRIGNYRGVVVWADGSTISEANWLTVLRDGTRATWSNRRELADAVRADTRGFERLLAEVPVAERGFFHTLHARMTAPQDERRHADPVTDAASRFVSQLALARCNYL